MRPTNRRPRNTKRLPAPCPLHVPPLSRPSATLSPPCGERARRGVPIWFMAPMRVQILVQGFNARNFSGKSFHEPPPPPGPRPPLLPLGGEGRGPCVALGPDRFPRSFDVAFSHIPHN